MTNLSPSTISISLSRLITRLEASLGDEQQLSLLNEVELQKAAANIDNARKLLIQLERSEGQGKPDSNTIGRQRKRILELHNKVSDAQLRQANLSEAEDEEEDKPVPSATPNQSNEPTAVLRNRLFGDREVGKETSSENALQHHRMMQDELSEAMLGMARGLKERTVAFGEALREDSKIVDNATNMLMKNADKMASTGGRLQQYSQTSRGMTWLILGSIVAVFIAWLFMYFIIRLT